MDNPTNREIQSSIFMTIIIIFFAQTCNATLTKPNLSESGQTASATELEAGFMSPPDSARPRVWWHWTAGNVTKEGITKDLEWMKRVGIGGMHMADGSSGSGQTVEQKIVFFTPEWFDAVHHSAAEADRLGLELRRQQRVNAAESDECVCSRFVHGEPGGQQCGREQGEQ